MSTNGESGNKSNVIIYSGDDLSYWNTIQERFKQNYPSRQFEFVRLFDPNPENYQDVFVQFLKQKALIIYMDFSKNTKTQVKLCLSLKRVSHTKETTIIGLCDNVELRKECWSSGAHLTHIKCGEYHDVIYHAVRLAAPELVIKPDFAVARFEQEVELIEDFRLGYISATTLHAEGNFDVRAGTTLEIESEIPSDIMPSKRYVVKSVSQTGMYYDFDDIYELEHIFVDPPPEKTKTLVMAENEKDENKKKVLMAEAQAEIKQLNAEYEKSLKVSKKKVKEWVLDNSDNASAKVTKILMVSEGMNVLKGEKESLDQYPYTIRMQTTLHPPFEEFSKMRPDIIAINFLEEEPESEKKDSIEDEAEKKAYLNAATSKLGEIVKTIKGIDDYTPFIILFNCQNYTSRSLQESYEYPLTIAYNGSMKMEEILKLASLFEKKQTEKKKKFLENKLLELRKEDPAKYGRLNVSDLEETKYYIRKSNNLSFASLKHDVSLVQMSESELMIKLQKPLPLGKYRLEDPVNCSIKLIPIEGEPFFEKDEAYFQLGLITFVDEDEKKEVRRYVNDIFFTDLNDERAAEEAEAEQIKKDALKAKVAESSSVDDESSESVENQESNKSE